MVIKRFNTHSFRIYDKLDELIRVVHGKITLEKENLAIIQTKVAIGSYTSTYVFLDQGMRFEKVKLDA